MFKGATQTIISIILLLLFFLLYAFMIFSITLPYRVFPSGSEMPMTIVISILLAYLSVDLIHHLKESM